MTVIIVKSLCLHSTSKGAIHQTSYLVRTLGPLVLSNFSKYRIIANYLLECAIVNFQTEN